MLCGFQKTIKKLKKKIIRFMVCPHNNINYIYMEREREREREGGWVQVTSNVTLSNVIPPNILLLNSYFKNPTVKLHVLYILNMHANFHANRI